MYFLQNSSTINTYTLTSSPCKTFQFSKRRYIQKESSTHVEAKVHRHSTLPFQFVLHKTQFIIQSSYFWTVSDTRDGQVSSSRVLTRMAASTRGASRGSFFHSFSKELGLIAPFTPNELLKGLITSQRPPLSGRGERPKKNIIEIAFAPKNR